MLDLLLSLVVLTQFDILLLGREHQVKHIVLTSCFKNVRMSQAGHPDGTISLLRLSLDEPDDPDGMGIFDFIVTQVQPFKNSILNEAIHQEVHVVTMGKIAGIALKVHKGIRLSDGLPELSPA